MWPDKGPESGSRKPGKQMWRGVMNFPTVEVFFCRKKLPWANHEQPVDKPFEGVDKPIKDMDKPI